MNIIALPDRTRTARIGFGCANLFAGPGLPAAHRLVRGALDAGIRHFDTAPAYGSGTSEDALAAALDGCNVSVTITTKLGIARPSQATPLAGLRVRQMARRVLSFAPGLRESLGRLRRERVDVLLLHEPEPADMTDELVRWMEDKVAQGRAGTVGFGARRENVSQSIRAWPGVPFVQTAWSPFGPPELGQANPFLSLHGALRQREALGARIQADYAFRGRLICRAPAAPTGTNRAAV